MGTRLQYEPWWNHLRSEELRSAVATTAADAWLAAWVDGWREGYAQGVHIGLRQLARERFGRLPKPLADVIKAIDADKSRGAVAALLSAESIDEALVLLQGVK